MLAFPRMLVIFLQKVTRLSSLGGASVVEARTEGMQTWAEGNYTVQKKKDLLDSSFSLMC